MDLTTAIEAFNNSSSPQISFFTARDGSCIANLPRVEREIIVGDAQFSDRKVTAEDIAWLCEEARRASAPGMALVEAALTRLAISTIADREIIKRRPASSCQQDRVSHGENAWPWWGD